MSFDPTMTTNTNLPNDDGLGLGGRRSTRKVRKLQLRDFRAIPPLPTDYHTTQWTKLESVIREIFRTGEVGLGYSLEELYKSCENLVRLGHAPYLHGELRKIFDNHVVELLTNLRQTYKVPFEFVSSVQASWLEFLNQMSLIRAIFTFLDRSYALPTFGVSSIWDMGLNIFRSRVLEAPDVHTQTLEIILDRIGKERNGEIVDRTCILTLLRMIHDLGLYGKEFEVQLLYQAEQFYKQQANTTINGLDLLRHIEYVETKVEEEQNRIQTYLARTTGRPLLTILYKELVTNVATTFPTKGFTAALFQTPDPAIIKRLYTLFVNAEDLPSFHNLFYDQVKNLGTELIKNPDHDRNMIDNVIQFRRTILNIVKEAFDDSQEIQRLQVRAFEEFMATRGSMPAILLAKAIDQVLRAGNTQFTDLEVDQNLELMFQLFRFIHGKDVFEAFYKQSLAKRLLLARSASYDSERVMIAKLKHQLGTEYTEKLDGMFRDMELSDDITKQFKERYGDVQFDLTVNVLTQAFWPTYPPALVRLPPQMESSLKKFASFYIERHSGRRLFWQPALSSCVVQAWYGSSFKHLVVSLYQAVVLLLFNDHDELSVRSIREQTGLESDQLKLALGSLSTPKLKFLTKPSKSKSFKDDEKFLYNAEFQNPSVKLKVNAHQLKETVRGDNKIQEMVIHNRMFLIDALIVRLMKTRRQMRHLDIMTESLRGLRFPVEPYDIKSRIDNLLEREFLERSEHDPELLIYVA